MRPVLPLLLLAPGAAAQELGDDPPVTPPVWEELLRLRARLDALERQEGGEHEAGPVAIDLSGEELPSLAQYGEHVLARPWYENLRLFGYGALAYIDSGGTGTTPNGSFLVKEASLFLDAEVWQRTFLFTEVWLARYQFGSNLSLAEFYLQFTDLFARGDGDGLGLKLGRFEIPFGEEYLRWDADVMPLITLTAADPYGLDEGLQLYGALGGAHWITAVTNGNGSGADDGAAKLLCAKLYGEPCADLYLSASVLGSDSTESSALRLGGSAITPVGANGTSSAGASPNDEVDSLMWELDARLGGSRTASLGLQFGQAEIDDDDDAFDRELLWFLVEPTLRLRDDLELVLRWSEIGTYDDDEGYRFEGKILADAGSFGYDTRVLRRLAVGLRWKAHPRLAVKFEVGEDELELIDASALDPENDERLYFGFEVVGSF